MKRRKPSGSKVRIMDEDNMQGRYLVLWRQLRREVAKVLSIDKIGFKVRYELVTGPDKGKQMSSLFDPTGIVTVYDEQDAAIFSVKKRNFSQN